MWWPAMLASLTSSCQHYEPRPLDLIEHHREWQSRLIESHSVHNFLNTLQAPEPDLSEFNIQDGLTLAEGDLVAWAFHPDNRLARMQAARADASRQQAGRWQDPQLSLDLLRITESVPDAWVVASALAFSIPTSGRLQAERQAADANHRAAQEKVREQQWLVRVQLRRSWCEWSAAQLRVETTQQHLDTIRDLLPQTKRLIELGEMNAAAATVFAVEFHWRSSQLQRQLGEVQAAEQQLRSRLGLTPQAPVQFVAQLLELEDSLEPKTPEELWHRHPRLAWLRERYQVAEERLHQEICKQYPDLTFGPQFESEQGQTRVGLLGLIPLPMFNANRRAIAEAKANREFARVQLETEWERLVGERAAARALAQSVTTQRREMEHNLVPLVDQQLSQSAVLLQLGESNSLLLIEALRQAYEVKLEWIDVRLAESLLAAQLESLDGPPPPSENSFTEQGDD